MRLHERVGERLGDNAAQQGRREHHQQKMLYSASENRQVPERFEGGAPDTLTSKAGTAASQPATLAGKVKLASAEPLEIKAEVK